MKRSRDDVIFYSVSVVLFFIGSPTSTTHSQIGDLAVIGPRVEPSADFELEKVEYMSVFISEALIDNRNHLGKYVKLYLANVVSRGLFKDSNMS